MELILQPSKKRAIASLNSDSDLQFVEPAFGESIPLRVAKAEAIVSPTGQRVFEPESWDGWTNLKAGIGNGFAAPVAGEFYLLSGIALTAGVVTNAKRFKIIDFNAGDSFTNIGAASNATGVVFTATGTTPTTWANGSELQEITADLAFDADEDDVETALNATAWVTAAGGVTVDTDGQLYFFVTFTTAGVQTQIVGHAGSLAPLSIIDAGTLIEGDAQIQEVQTLRVFQNVASFVELTGDSTPADVTFEELTEGAPGANHKVRATLTQSPYGGYFSVKIRAVESELVAFDASGETLQAALEALAQTSGALIAGAKYKIVAFETGDDFANVGAVANETGEVFTATGTTPTVWTNGSELTPVGVGNVTVVKEGAGRYLVSMKGDMAATDMGTFDKDASALLSVEYKEGDLNLDTDGIALLLGSATSITTFLAITGVPPGESYPQELFRKSIVLNAAVIDPAMIAPTPRVLFYTATESDERFAALGDDGAVMIGTEARLLPVANGFKIQVSTDGLVWQDAATYTAS